MTDKKKIIIGIIIGVILILIWLHFINIDKVFSYLKKLKLFYIIIAAFLYLFSYFIRSLRWRYILKPVKKLTPQKTFLIWIGGNFLNYIIPIRAGEFAKAYFLKRTDNIAISRSLPSIFIDKVFDSLAIFVVLALIPFLEINISKTLTILLIILVALVIIGICILIVAAVNKKIVVKFFHKFFFFIPQKYEKKFFEITEIFVEGIGLFKNHYNMLPTISLLTLLAVIIDSVYFFTVFKAFGQTIAFPLILFGYTLIYLSYILPYPPGQLGSNELIMVIIFSVGLGLDKDMVSAVMSFAHLLTGILIIGVGLSSMSYIGVKLLDTFKDVKIDSMEDKFEDK
ncbi:MAG: flippase-like domain-containing protein [Candidatus Cloacimonetes bacterium]|nr:flippase-like domain-containing protein [Candidatus Cloacimonadota bacterium]